MVNKLARTSRNGSLLFEPEIVEHILQPSAHNSTMSSQSSNLFTLARSKLNLSSDSKDNFSLHRWVLIKNSIIQSLPLTAASSPSADDAATSEEDDGDDDIDSFMFPDAGTLLEGFSSEASVSEAAWLDSLLETLGEDDDYDLSPEPEVHVSLVAVDDDEDLGPSPPISPMSSSDDLTAQSYYPYLVPYPPYSPPLVTPCSLASSSSVPHVDPLPYCDLDDLEDFPPVPDAIEDTSDDESETPPTPGQSLSSLSLDPASIPLPAEHSRLRYSTPHIYIEEEDEYFSPFDPLPFPHNPPVDYSEC
ncbi:hypothetical protein GGX14DRAFT_590121 [Mycena pura]|uniref:Uncharacterized protein n=1 Tax=Mycena pura TaxID=153505 RepID=A0AAD6VPA6_9AGAR|nr:hypothetical protein GGX14DRAFT_590121 [Mycena pura]